MENRILFCGCKMNIIPGIMVEVVHCDTHAEPVVVGKEEDPPDDWPEENE